MKVIISHDVDHLSVREHLKDMIIPKFIARALIERLTGKISSGAFFRRMHGLIKGRWHRIPELVKYNVIHGIPATFFFGMARGLGMTYRPEAAESWIRYVQKHGMDAGVHGICFSNDDLIRKERERFSRITGNNRFGIRMHYLRKDENTYRLLSRAGYLFDSTEYGLKPITGHYEMWEIPVSLMDGVVFEAGRQWQVRNIEQAILFTLEILQEAVKRNISYFVILFHDRYFDPAFPDWMKWYQWLTVYIAEQGWPVIPFRQAVDELNAKAKGT
ncbi:MAG: hypothetical protein JW861_09380 [Bacteroidales bacterium]|nr:hypothetical protein [Bacteroidales bacterium]